MDSKIQTSDKKTFLKNVIIVIIGNVFSLASGVLIGFVIPKIMGVAEYGYYKTFTLFCSYIVVLHFGFIDGIYLKFAGKKYDELEKEKFRAFTRFLFIFETVITSVFVLLSLALMAAGQSIVFLFVSLNIFATNIISYYDFISQIILRFKRSTVRTIIRCSLNIVSVLVLFLLSRYQNLQIYNYTYVAIVLAINYILVVWYLITYRDISFGKSYSFREMRDEIVDLFKAGAPLLLSNWIAYCLFIVDQQVVNAGFDNETYSIYAFAYNMISLITIATNAVSTVLYPTLKTMNSESIKSNYSRINSYLLLFVAFCLLAYYPLVLIVRVFLPDYSDSLIIFLIILPGVLISSSISVIKYNCYKTFGLIKNYLVKSAIILAIALASDLVVYFVFRNSFSKPIYGTIPISLVSIVVLIIWYVAIEFYFVRAFRVKWAKNLIYVLLVVAGFYGISFIDNLLIEAGTYVGFYLTLSLTLYFKEIKEIVKKVQLKRQGVIQTEPEK